jgi:hypothetical protein
MTTWYQLYLLLRARPMYSYLLVDNRMGHFAHCCVLSRKPYHLLKRSVAFDKILAVSCYTTFSFVSIFARRTTLSTSPSWLSRCVRSEFLFDFNQNLNIPTNFSEMPRHSNLPIYNQAKKQCHVVANSHNLRSGGASFDCRSWVRHINS